MSLSTVIAVVEAEADFKAFADAGAKVVHAAADGVRKTAAALGRAAADTWAVTDSSVAVNVARELGLHVCYVGPDAAFSSADIALHGWAELTPALLDDYAEDEGEQPASACRVLVVCGSPEPSSPELVRALAAEADNVIACDRGATACKDANVVPQVFVGDGDSADIEALAWVQSVVERNITFPPEKYATDLALAIEAARHEAARRCARPELTLTCASGGRPDHALAVTGQLLKAKDACPRVVEDGFELRVLSPEGASVWELPQDAQGRTLSVVALAPDTVVSEHGLQWELDSRELPLLGDEGISNVVESTSAEVICHSGALAVYLLS